MSLVLGFTNKWIRCAWGWGVFADPVKGDGEMGLASFRRLAEGFKALDTIWLMVAWVVGLRVNAEVGGDGRQHWGAALKEESRAF